MKEAANSGGSTLCRSTTDHLGMPCGVPRAGPKTSLLWPVLLSIGCSGPGLDAIRGRFFGAGVQATDSKKADNGNKRHQQSRSHDQSSRRCVHTLSRQALQADAELGRRISADWW